MSGGKLASGVLEQGGARVAGFANNIGIEAATTTNANDSIKITGADGSDLSPVNYGWVTLPGATPGQLTPLSMTANVTIDLTGATFGYTVDLTDKEIAVYALNNNGALVWGLSINQGDILILDTNDDATAANVNSHEKVLVNSALSADAQAVQIGYFKANFDYTGGAAEALWAVQTADQDINPNQRVLEHSDINLIDNPEGLLMQRIDPSGGTAVNDDVYGPDRWNVLCSANDVTVSREASSIPSGVRHAIQLDKTTAGGWFGIEQIKEGRDSIPLRGEEISFKFSAKTDTTEVTAIRASILGWTSTEDTVTSDIVSVWAAAPTYIANISDYGTKTFTVTSSYQEFEVRGVVGATCNNLIFFIHTTTEEAVNDTLYLTKMYAQKAEFDMPYRRRRDQEEQQICDRYYQKSYNVDVVPGTNTAVGLHTLYMEALASNDNTVKDTVHFKTRMRSTPTTESYSTAGTADRVDMASGEVNSTRSGAGDGSFTNQGTNGAATTWRFLLFHWTADIEL